MWLKAKTCALAVSLAAVLAVPAVAGVVPVTIGASWDGPSQTLQKIVDARYGAGVINVATDYMGAHATDPDPWFWIDSKLSALLVTEVAGNADYNVVGWYEETGTKPAITGGTSDGVIFNGSAGKGTMTIVTFNHPMTRFGFYLNPNGDMDATWAPEPEKFYTNRFYNDLGPNGGGAVHAPFDGDVQALVYDVSRFTQPNTWLVCFEDLDAGANPSPCCYPTDNDYNDFVFEVTAFGATPTVPMTFGALKAKYVK